MTAQITRDEAAVMGERRLDMGNGDPDTPQEVISNGFLIRLSGESGASMDTTPKQA